MTKSLLLDPNVIRQTGAITFNDIPVNTYKKTVSDEKGNYTDEEFIRIYRDMFIIREFESMINSIKRTKKYEVEVDGKVETVEYDHPGPAHLGIGQEAAYVGQAFCLDIDDFIFGSHRSHGEILAKALSAIEKLTEEELLQIMESFFDGETFAVVKKYQQYTAVKDVAREFLLYGAMAEVFGRKTGFNRGLGGSMHTFFTPFGIYPNNALVGGSAPIATGAALYKRVNKKKGYVICNIGDASLGCGPVMESLNFASMDQFTQLWEDGQKGGLPIIFNIFNNQYGMGGQTGGETMGYGTPARLAAGFTPTMMHTEKIDGFNPLAVIDAYKRKLQVMKEEGGPIFLDILTYRFSGHSPSDASTYRTQEEVEMWEAQDSIPTYAKELIEAGVATEEQLAAIRAQVQKEMIHACRLATDLEISPRIDLEANPNAIADLMFSNQKVESMDTTRTPEVSKPIEENANVKRIANKPRGKFDKNGKPVTGNRMYKFNDALFESIINKFYQDPTLVAYGEDNRDWGGAYAVYRDLTESIPYHRFFNSPISEAAIVGTGVGYAMCGGRAITELMYSDFIGRAGDEIFNQMSKWQAMSAGVLKMPLVLRMSVGSKYGAQHSQDWSALCAHVPGLKVVFPATPYDAKGLMNAALNGTDPVIFLESQRLYNIGEQFKEEVPAEYYEVEIGEPDVKKEGKDLTILSIGATLYRVMDAVKILEEKYGMSVEVIDARSLVPFNYEKVIESVKKTGKIVITGDACERGSQMKEFAQSITELAFDYLDAPPVVVGAKDWITPAHEMEQYFFPQAEWIVDAVNEKIVPLPGHVATANFTNGEYIRANKKGV